MTTPYSDRQGPMPDDSRGTQQAEIPQGGLRAVGYIRASNGDDPPGYSLDAQRADIEHYCEQHGYELTAIYEEAVSLPTEELSERPEFCRLLERARQGEFDVVMVHTMDRWARNMLVQAETLQILCEARVRFVSVMECLTITTDEAWQALVIIGEVMQFFPALVRSLPHLSDGASRMSDGVARRHPWEPPR